MLTLVLNSYLLFQNVYTTYKALKPPKPSRKARHGVDPLAKAKAARKRELKGMLACWIVWSCWSTAEAIADRTISVLTPFYSEIKMFLILFLIAGRSAMAEPILLHVIRPLIKPYYVPLDACVDIFVSAADLAVLLFSSPLVWIRLVTRHAWNFLQKTFSRGSASLPRPGNHAVSASDADESLNEPNTPSESADATKAKEQEPDPLQRFVPKTRGTLNQDDSDEEDVVYKNPLRDDPPPYGVPVDVPVSRGRDYPPVFSSPRGTSRVRREPSPGSRPFVGRRMSVIDRQPYDISMATSASYRPDSEAETSFAFSPNNSQDILNGAGDLAPDPNIPAFALASPAQPPVSVPAAPAVPSYLQPRTRASRINLRPAPPPVDNYADRPNPRASEFLQGERGMTFADKPKESKAIIPDASASYVSPPPSGYGLPAPQPIPASPPQVPFGNPYVRGRPGPTRPYVPAEDGYESPRGNNNDLIQNWRQRSAIPVDVKPKRQQGPSGYSYQAATPSQVPPTLSVVSPSIAPSFPVPSVAPSFPVPSIAPSLTPSQSISNVFARPQPGYRPPSAADNRPPTTGPARPQSTTPSHPPTTTTGMGLGAPRRQRSTRELRAQAWEPKEDNTAAEAERLAEEERRALEQKEAERQNALDRQRRKVSDSQYQRSVKSKKLTGDAPPTRSRTKAKAKHAGRKVAAEKDKNVTNEDCEDKEVEVHEDDGDEVDGEESPRKRRRVGGDGESVAVVGPSRKPAPASAGVTGSSVTLPAKRPIGEVTSDAKPRPLRVAPKPPLNRARPLTSKRERPARLAAQPSTSRPTKPTHPPVSRLPRANNSKSLASHAFPSGSRNITKN